MTDLDDLEHHFNPEDPRLVGDGPLLGDGLWHAVDAMIRRCPVAHSDSRWMAMPEGGWIVSRYDDALATLKDTSTFSSRVRRGDREEPPLIPMDLDPPLSLEYRRMLQPYLTQGALEPYVPVARRRIAELVDAVLPAGRCADLVSQIARPFASDVQWSWLAGVGEFDRERALKWVLDWTHDHFGPEYERSEREWVAWTDATIAARRSGPRRDDLVDALVHGEIQGRPLTDAEIAGIMNIMIVGGVSTTADAIGNIVLRLAVQPELQERLRSEPDTLPRAIEELLRLEPPAAGPSRRCTRDTEIRGKRIAAGQQVFVHLTAANRDPSRFPDPGEFRLDRPSTANLAFGFGHHRCLGATFARQNLRIALEEILRRMKDIRLVDDDPPRRNAGIVWGVAHLPIAFTAAPT
jgi:cytochrome P450